ncbi:Initiator tRNA phosphoribosyl transferase [Corchorus capsularis]|uniref:Initiator tRNA phosphoribosyl transferase n=1 Tax=Corchorus capsularis TaxID=210143 RepID=A0A1R3IJC3_COCAP|nr:Initiator tRNA phosphoribosyl transferase [Corchorus capsularis]
MENEAKLSIYRAARTIKRKENTVYNALRSIYEDSIFVGEISQLWPQLPLVANLRCGLWYSPKFHSTCYFKSTDGHNNNWSFSTSRLNFHIALLAGQKGGCRIVDSTRRGKRFPDSMSKTIPIWTCVLNRSISNYLNNNNDGSSMEVSFGSLDTEQKSVDWDCSLHLPLWVSGTEKAAIEERLEGWTRDLEASGADIAALASCLKKPLRPLWISQKTVIWINEVPDYDSWDFTPIILVSASLPSGVPQHRTTSEFSWNYIPGAGDDEESWARGLSPYLFWNHAYDLISSGPDLCNQKVADMVEKDRVYRAQRGQNAPQITAKPSISESSPNFLSVDPLLCSDLSNLNVSCSDEESGIYWLGSTNLALSSSQVAENATNVDCILNCDQRSITVHLPEAEAYLHLPILNSKFDRFSLFNNLSSAVSFAKSKLTNGRTLLVSCHDGEDISVCICLAILISLYNDEGSFDGGKSFSETGITKSEMRRRLVYICKFAIKARPSRVKYGFK